MGPFPLVSSIFSWDSKKKKKNFLGIIPCIHDLPAYPAENNIKIYLPNGDPTTRYSSLVENVFGLSLHPVTAIGTRPGGDDHDPVQCFKWTSLTILPRSININL